MCCAKDVLLLRRAGLMAVVSPLSVEVKVKFRSIFMSAALAALIATAGPKSTAVAAPTVGLIKPQVAPTSVHKVHHRRWRRRYYRRRYYWRYGRRYHRRRWYRRRYYRRRYYRRRYYPYYYGHAYYGRPYYRYYYPYYRRRYRRPGFSIYIHF